MDSLSGSRTSSLSSFHIPKGSYCATKLNFQTQHGRHFLLAILLSVGFVPVLTLLIQNLIRVSAASKTLTLNNEALAIVEAALGVKEVIYSLQLERGYSSLYASSGGDIEVRNAMLSQRMHVDDTLLGLSLWPGESQVGNTTRMSSLRAQRESLIRFRHDIDVSNSGEYDIVDYFSGDISVFLAFMGTLVRSVGVAGAIWPRIVAFISLSHSTEEAGQERAKGAIFFSTGFLRPEKVASYVANMFLGDQFLAQAADFSPLVNQQINSEDMLRLRQQLFSFREIIKANGSQVWSQLPQQVAVEVAKEWVGNMTIFIDSLNSMQTVVGESIKEWVLASSDEQREATRLSSTLLVMEFVSFPIFTLLTIRLIAAIKRLSSVLTVRLTHLLREQRRNAVLVKEMYPQVVAVKLLKGQEIPPEEYPSATVCFSGIWGFERLSRQSSGASIIYFINRLFDIMDDEITRHDVFKVETVGDQYLVVSGLPLQNGFRHVTEIANMAQAMIARTRELRVDHMPSVPIQLAFGICSGSVGAGIVGAKMPRYCLFGDTVNMASRMQSSSLPLCVHLSSSARDLLVHTGTHLVTPRGKINIKGKGFVETFWLASSAPT